MAGMAGNGFKWLQIAVMTEIGWKWLEMAGMARNGGHG